MCDTDLEHKIFNGKKYASMSTKSESLESMQYIKQLMYKHGDKDLQTEYSHAMAVQNFYAF